MNEQNQEFDPRDINKDGKVSAKEKLMDAAEKANEALYEVADVIKDEAVELYGKVKDYQAAFSLYDLVFCNLIVEGMTTFIIQVVWLLRNGYICAVSSSRAKNWIKTRK